MKYLNELIIAWKDFGIESIVLGAENYYHDLNKNIIYLTTESEFRDGDHKVKIYGDGRIIFKKKEYILKKEEVAVIDSKVEIYDEETFKKKYL